MRGEPKNHHGFFARVVVYEDQIISGVLTKIQFPMGPLAPLTSRSFLECISVIELLEN